MIEPLTYNRYLALQRGIRWQEIKGQLQAMLHCYPSTGRDYEQFKMAYKICEQFIEEMENNGGYG